MILDPSPGRCFQLKGSGSFKSWIPKFFYNWTSFKCERFHRSTKKSWNMFQTKEGCEELCSEKCKKPLKHSLSIRIEIKDDDDVDNSLSSSLQFAVIGLLNLGVASAKWSNSSTTWPVRSVRSLSSQVAVPMGTFSTPNKSVMPSVLKLPVTHLHQIWSFCGCFICYTTLVIFPVLLVCF